MPVPAAHQLIVYSESLIITEEVALKAQALLNAVLGPYFVVDIEEV